MQAGGRGFALSDLPYLQDDAVHWDGQPVAVVVAETLEDAEHAASLVRVEYEAAAEPAVSVAGEMRKAIVPENVLGEPAEIAIGDPKRRWRKRPSKSTTRTAPRDTTTTPSSRTRPWHGGTRTVR